MKNPKKDRDIHEPVMISEVIGIFEAQKRALLKKSCFVDATVGLAGHAKEFVKRGIFVIGIDADAESLKIAEDVLKKACRDEIPSRLKACPIPHQSDGAGCFRLLQGNFSEIDAIVGKVYKRPVGGILFDLGISSFQLDNIKHGFSFRHQDQSLDMRLDRKNQNVKAYDLLALLDKKKLKKVFAEVMTDNLAYRIADAVFEKRLQKPIHTVGDFLSLIKPLIRRKGKIDSATLPFLALRIAVNNEKENLENALNKAFKILATGGRIAVISFHSGEDRVVKYFFKDKVIRSEAVWVTKKPKVPEREEIFRNPRSRSAKMRVIEKL